MVYSQILIFVISLAYRFSISRTGQLPIYLEKIINKTNNFFKVDTDCISGKFGYKELNSMKEKYNNLRDGFKNSSGLYSKTENCVIYNTFYLPSNILKIPILLRDLFLNNKINYAWFDSRFDSKFDSKKIIKILDVGSGPGTNILAFLDFCVFLKVEFNYNIPKLEFTAIENNKDFIKILNKNLENTKKEFRKIKYNLNIKEEDAEGYNSDEKFDFIILGNILCEIVEFVKAFHKYEGMVKKDGLIVIIETDTTIKKIKNLKKYYIVDKKSIIYGECTDCNRCVGGKPCQNQIYYNYKTTNLVKEARKKLELPMSGYILCIKK